MRILAILALAALPLSGCTVGLAAGQSAVSSITPPTCPPGTKISGEAQAGGGFGAAGGFSIRFDCDGGAAK